MFDAKRLIGREFRDHNVQQDLKHWPFKVVDVGDKPKIQVEFKSEEDIEKHVKMTNCIQLHTAEAKGESDKSLVKLNTAGTKAEGGDENFQADNAVPLKTE